jgi:type IV secretory pathway VirB10-like protein
MTDRVDQMSPDASPGELSKKSGVRRVNNLPVYLVGGALAGFLAIMVVVAADRAAKPHEHGGATPEKGGDTRMFAAAIAGERKDGIIPPEGVAAQAVPSPGGLGDRGEGGPGVPIARPDNPDRLHAPPMPPNPGPAQRAARDEELTRIRMVKMQELEEAIKAKTSVQLVQLRTRGSPDPGALGSSAPATRDETLARLAAVGQHIDAAAGGDTAAAYKARMEQLRGAGLAGSGAPQLMQTAAASGARSDIAQFAASGSGQGDRWKLDSMPEAPRTPYELRAGFVVPATLISGINSALPGQIMAQVSQDVYDTPTGRHKLIPQGSRLVGAYSNDVAYGQSRVLIAWQRIIFPDGKAMDIGAMPGADGAGNAGFTDRVNNHYFRLFGSAFLMSGVVAGITLSQGNQNGNVLTAPTASSALSSALGQQLGQVTAQLIAKNLNIAPTLEIRPGYRFNVIVIKDMTFSKPYRAFDY